MLWRNTGAILAECALVSSSVLSKTTPCPCPCRCTIAGETINATSLVGVEAKVVDRWVDEGAAGAGHQIVEIYRAGALDEFLIHKLRQREDAQLMLAFIK